MEIGLGPHAYKVELEHCMHMSVCGRCVLGYVNLCEYVLNWFSTSMWKICTWICESMWRCFELVLCIYVEDIWFNDGDDVWMLYISLGD